MTTASGKHYTTGTEEPDMANTHTSTRVPETMLTTTTRTVNYLID